MTGNAFPGNFNMQPQGTLFWISILATRSTLSRMWANTNFLGNLSQDSYPKHKVTIKKGFRYGLKILNFVNEDTSLYDAESYFNLLSVICMWVSYTIQFYVGRTCGMDTNANTISSVWLVMKFNNFVWKCKRTKQF